VLEGGGRCGLGLVIVLEVPHPRLLGEAPPDPLLDLVLRAHGIPLLMQRCRLDTLL